MSDDILVRLRLAADQFKSQLDATFAEVPKRMEEQGLRAGDGFGSGFGTGFALKASAITATAAAGVAVVREAVTRSLELGRELDASAAQMGIGVETLQEWRYAARQAGIGAAELDDNVAELTRRIGEANAGNRAAQQAFVDLGVGFATADGRARSTEAAFRDVIEALSHIEDPSERARLGAALVGEEFARLEPLVRGGAEGIDQARIAAEQLGLVLSEEQIAKLNQANAAFERMNSSFGVSIAEVVADNASALEAMAQAAGNLAAGLIELFAQMSRYDPQTLGEIGNRQLFHIRADSKDEEKSFRYGTQLMINYGNEVFNGSTVNGADTELMWRAIRGETGQASAAAPSLSAGQQRGGGRGNPSGSAADRSAEREREAAIRASQRAEEEFEQSIQQTLQAQADSARIEGVRKEQGEAAAAAEQARLEYQRENPLAVHQTVEALTAALGITRALTAEERAHYENLIASADAAEQGAVAKATREAEQREFQRKQQEDQAQQEKIQTALKEQVDRAYEEQEASIRDLADLYEGLFTGGNGNIWKDFKQQGLRMVSEVAAQWTLALLSGQSGGGISPFGKGGGANPIATIFNAGGLLGGAVGDKAGAAPAGGITSAVGGLGQLLGIGWSSGGAVTNPIASAIAAVPGLNVAIAAAAVTHVVGEGIEKLTGLRFDALGGLFGGVIGGFAVGALKGAVKGNATIGDEGGQLGVVDAFGKRKFRDQAISDATGIMDTLAQIASGLGTDLNASLAAVSIGTRNGKYRVDPTGQGVLKKGAGAVDFGKDQEAAVAFAIRNLIEDGVLGPISQASRNILTSGGDLQQAIEKAVLIESVPKLLKQRLDPLSAELEQIDEQFRKLAEAMKEGGASAEQIAEARKLWQLEREDAIRQIGEASASLKDFLQSLNVGANSPLSLRQQKAEAEKALAPYIASIEQARAAQAEVDRLKAGGGSAADITAAEQAARQAAAAVDQAGFQNAAQALLGISRQIDASGGGFFADFDRIRSLTGGAIGAIDAAAGTPAAAQDPFSAATAKNTGDMAGLLKDIAAMTADTNRLLLALNDNGAVTTPGGPDVGSKKWLKQQRKFTNAG